MRELRGPDELLLPRDRAPIVYVPAGTWNCVLCEPPDLCICERRKAEHGRDEDHAFAHKFLPVSNTTVAWQGANTDGPHGRCSSCGQEYALARAGEHVPTPDEQRAPS